MIHTTEKIKSIQLYGDDIGRVELVDAMASDMKVVNAARVSFGVEKQELDEKDVKLIKYLIKHKHTSTLEHCTFTFKFVVPLYVRSQHHRHRTWCLAGDSNITFNRPDRWKTGKHCVQNPWKKDGFQISELYKKWNTKRGKKNIEKQLLRVYDEEKKLFTISHIKDIMYSGRKEIYEIELEDGKKIKCSENHQLYTNTGWKRLKEIGDLTRNINNTYSFNKEIAIGTNGTENLWKSYDWLKLQRDNGLSVTQISLLANCSYHTIRKWLKIHKLQFNQIETLLNFMKKNGPWNKGKTGYKTRLVVSEEHKKKISAARSGAKSNFWKGGVTKERNDIGAWTTGQASKVHKKYNFTCQTCFKTDGILHAHHIKPVVEYPQFAYDFDNLITICKKCHIQHHMNSREMKLGKGLELASIFKKIKTIKFVGVEDTYDIEVNDAKNHNFVANGIIVHNSYNEISRRYTEENIKFYEPEKYRLQHESNRQSSKAEYVEEDCLGTNTNITDFIKNYNLEAFKFYNLMIDAGVCREQARGVLPQSMYTEYYGTVNLNNLLKFIDSRTHEGAQLEIQLVAKACLRLAEQYCPVVFNAYKEVNGVTW